MKLLIILSKTFFFYIAITILYRLMGKREISQLKVVDLVVSMFIADIVAMGIENYDESIILSIGPVILLVILQVFTAKLSLKYVKIRNIVDGEASVIINRGKINFKEMLRQRYNLDDLLVELRSKGIKSIEEVDYAILEISGRLSVFTKNNETEGYPLPVILNGKIDNDVLIQIDKDEDWLKQILKDEGYTLEDVFYGFYKDDEIYLIKNEVIKWQNI